MTSQHDRKREQRNTKTSTAPLDVKSQESVRRKVELLQLAEQVGSVSRACAVMGYSRDSFYRFKALYEKGGEAALVVASRRKPLPANRVAPEIEAAVVGMAAERPSFGQARVAQALCSRGVRISPAGVRSVWLRHGLETKSKRLRALESAGPTSALRPVKAGDSVMPASGEVVKGERRDA